MTWTRDHDRLFRAWSRLVWARKAPAGTLMDLCNRWFRHVPGWATSPAHLRMARRWLNAWRAGDVGMPNLRPPRNNRFLHKAKRRDRR